MNWINCTFLIGNGIGSNDVFKKVEISGVFFCGYLALAIVIWGWYFFSFFGNPSGFNFF